MASLAGKIIAKVWTMSSSSSSKTYETLQYTDGSTSCNCPGWTRRVASDGSRSCKHTKAVDDGRADNMAVGMSDYTTNKASAPVTDSVAKAVTKSTKQKAKKVDDTPVKSIRSRRVQWQ
jgi:hypothetical protein